MIVQPFSYLQTLPIVSAAPGGIVATGGEISSATIDGVLYKIHKFTSSADFVVTSGEGNVDYLIVAGGGGGGGSNFAADERGGAGGGGAGGAKTGSLSVSAQTYVVKVGNGGAGSGTNTSSPGANGQTSSFASVSSTGGGGGASSLSRTGSAGGSGGGGAAYVTTGAGGLGTSGEGKNGGSGSNDGARPGGGGGGGASTAGSNSVGTDAGNGGNGLLVNFTGINTYYAGGGGGSVWQQLTGDDPGIGGLGGGGNGCSGSSGTPGNGVDGFGGGGGGGRKSVSGGTGGKGVVIIKYPSGSAPNVVTDGLVIYMDATNAASYPGTGSSIFNLVAGQVYTGSLVNSPTYKDNFIQLNGTNQYISIPHPGYASGTSTVMGATRYADTAGNGRMFSGGVSGNNWLLGHYANTTENYYPGGTVQGVPGGPNDTNWRIYTGTGNTTTDRWDFYINGVNAVTSSAAGANGLNTPLNIGRQGENNSEYSSGSFGFVLIYNRVLSPAEVTQNYDAFKDKFGLT